MNTQQTTKNYPRFEREAVNIVLGESIGSNVFSGIRHGASITRSGEYGNVLYINTVQTSRQLGESIRKVLGAETKFGEKDKVNTGMSMYFETIHRGEVPRKAYDILEYVKWKGVKTIIINSWEFSSKNYQFREELYFMLIEMTEGHCSVDEGELTILVYAQSPSKIPEAGKAQRGGLGKLAGLAKAVIVLSEETESVVDSRLSIAGQESESSGTDSQSVRQELDAVSGGLRDHPTEDSHPTEVDEELEEINVPTEVGPSFPIPSTLAKMPIHMNNFVPSKEPLASAPRMSVLNKQLPENKEVAEASAENSVTTKPRVLLL